MPEQGVPTGSITTTSTGRASKAHLSAGACDVRLLVVHFAAREPPSARALVPPDLRVHVTQALACACSGSPAHAAAPHLRVPLRRQASAPTRNPDIHAQGTSTQSTLGKVHARLTLVQQLDNGCCMLCEPACRNACEHSRLPALSGSLRHI